MDLSLLTNAQLDLRCALYAATVRDKKNKKADDLPVFEAVLDETIVEMKRRGRA